jgi:DtxR family transcriptional regulator, Mn-dependent transcriptional regulator
MTDSPTTILSLSESEEMYLATIAKLKESGGPGPVPITLLASEMDILPVSANQMVRKLEELGLVLYTPYQGVELTAAGGREARRILRGRRLWEVFLVERLQYEITAAAPLACRLEHYLPPEAAERLAGFLGNPLESPDGRSIPGTNDPALVLTGLPLSQLEANTSGLVIDLPDDPATRGFLLSHGIQIGVPVTVLAHSRGEILAAGSEGSIRLSEALARMILVRTK